MSSELDLFNAFVAEVETYIAQKVATEKELNQKLADALAADTADKSAAAAAQAKVDELQKQINDGKATTSADSQKIIDAIAATRVAIFGPTVPTPPVAPTPTPVG